MAVHGGLFAVCLIIFVHQELIRNIPFLGWYFDCGGNQCLVEKVIPGLSADRAGVRAGDVVHQMAGRVVSTDLQIDEIYRSLSIGDQLDVVLLRGSKSFQVTLDVQLFHYAVRYTANSAAALFFCVLAWRAFYRTQTLRGALFAATMSLFGMSLAIEFFQIAEDVPTLLIQLALVGSFHLWPATLFHLLWDYPSGFHQPATTPLQRMRAIVYWPPVFLYLMSVVGQLIAFASSADISTPASWRRLLIIIPLAMGLAYSTFLIMTLAFGLSRRMRIMDKGEQRETAGLYLVLALAVLPPLLSGPLSRALQLSPMVTPFFKFSLILLPLYLGERLVRAQRTFGSGISGAEFKMTDRS